MRALDRTREFAVVSGVAEHKYEQDGLRFDHVGACIDDKDYKKPGAPRAQYDTATTTATDPAIQEQITLQTGSEAPPDDAGAPDTTGELETLGLSSKVESALRGSEIDSVDALCRCTEAQILAMPNIGDAAVKAIKKALKTAGKTLS